MMKPVRDPGAEAPLLTGWGVHVLFLTAEGCETDRWVRNRLAGLGAIVEAESDFYVAVDRLSGRTEGFGLFIMDCDAHGGLEEAQRLLPFLRQIAPSIPVAFLSSQSAQHAFPEDERQPVILRKPLSAVSLRVGFSHAMRHRLVCPAA